MAGQPLSPATRRRLGRPLPYQLADGTWAAPRPAGPDRGRDPHPLTTDSCIHTSLVVSSSITPPFGGLSSCLGYVTHALLTLSPRYSYPEGYFRARLAWVSHAASVRSEPGSNPSLEISYNTHLCRCMLFSAKVFDLCTETPFDTKGFRARLGLKILLFGSNSVTRI